MRNLTARTFRLMRSRLPLLPKKRLEWPKRSWKRKRDLCQLSRFVGKPDNAQRLRIHGDFHLGQVLYTGKDFIIIDFEGEPARSLSERRLKRSPLQDVAGMLRSFHYAAYHAIFSKGCVPKTSPPWRSGPTFGRFGCPPYLKTYLDIAGPADFLPRDAGELQILLNALCLEKAIYELGYELNNRPDWVSIPLMGILQLLKTPGDPSLTFNFQPSFGHRRSGAMRRPFYVKRGQECLTFELYKSP